HNKYTPKSFLSNFWGAVHILLGVFIISASNNSKIEGCSASMIEIDRVPLKECRLSIYGLSLPLQFAV
ncbi:MAG: hypothetical protein Q3988_02260, partial [Gemella sp.]|nr:hypothetical protein [Gemella sp.]